MFEMILLQWGDWYEWNREKVMGIEANLPKLDCSTPI